jgi:hypothetical protein
MSRPQRPKALPRMIPKSGYRFSEKIMLWLKLTVESGV